MPNIVSLNKVQLGDSVTLSLTATNIEITAIAGLAATDVQQALEEINADLLAVDASVPDTTDELSEGVTNLYFTDARAITALTGQNISIFTNDSGYLIANETITLSGDVTGSGTTAITATLVDESVTNAKLAHMAQDTIKGRITASTGDPEDLTAANIRTITVTETTTQLNARDTANRSRVNHTGTQIASTISDFSEAVDDRVSALLVAGSGIGLAYDDGANALTISNTSSLDTEAVQDIVGGMVTGNVETGVTVTYDDINGKLDFTLVTSGNWSGTFDGLEGSAYLSRANHTGTQVASTISDFSEAVDDRVGALLTEGAGIDLTYNDAGNTLTVASTITQYTDELAQDAVGGILLNGSGLTWTYNDTTPSISAVVAIPSTSITDFTEAVQDVAGGMVTGNTETGITVTYDDGTGKLNFVLDYTGNWTGTFDGQEGTYYLSRANHTGTQIASTISDFNEAVDDRVSALLVAGSGIGVSYDDGANTLTISNTASLDTEAVQDIVGGMVTGNTETGITVTYDDGAGKLNFVLVTSGDWTGTFDGLEGTAYLSRANHTGTQTLATISDSGALATLDTVGTTQVDNNAITYAKIQQASVGFTILAKPATGAGNFSELAAGTDGVLRRSGAGNIAFGTIVAGNIASDAVITAKILDANVTFAKIQDITADRLLGRVSTTGDVQELTLGTGLEFNGTAIDATATGGGPSLGTDSIIRTNAKVIEEDITFLGTENGMTAGPVEVATGFTVTVTSGSTWVIV